MMFYTNAYKKCFDAKRQKLTNLMNEKVIKLIFSIKILIFIIKDIVWNVYEIQRDSIKNQKNDF